MRSPSAPMRRERTGLARLLLGSKPENEMQRAVVIVCVAAFVLEMLRLVLFGAQ